jgi:hypothetical protein
VRTLNDELGELIRRHYRVYEEHGFAYLVHKTRGRGDIKVRGAARQHPAAGMIERMGRIGVPVNLQTPPWSQAELDERVRRGPHQSCMAHLDFLRQELLDFVRKGFWILLPYAAVKDLPGLRVSPMGVVPQRDRRPRLIVDYSFYEVNQGTVPVAPVESMQFGRTLERILAAAVKAHPRYGEVMGSKVDLSDGFYRIWVAMSGIPKLAVVFPQYPGEDQMIAFPLALPMGWINSPPYFCSVTESIADIANWFTLEIPFEPHPLEVEASTLPAELTSRDRERETSKAPARIRRHNRPLDVQDVYVDDFVGLVQGGLCRQRRHLRRLLHTIDLVFRPKDQHDSPWRNHVPSIKKFKKGDGAYLTHKTLLGWVVDTLKGTVGLPAHRQARLLAILQELQGKDKIQAKEWHKVVGELRSMTLAIPGSRNHFSVLQHALATADRSRVRITKAVKSQLRDLELLAKAAERNPSRLHDLIPDDPVLTGPCDASGEGMGGAWIPRYDAPSDHPIVWRSRFPPDVLRDLASRDCPDGPITNSDLELAGTIAHLDVAAHQFPLQGRTVLTVNDNTSAVAWRSKGSATTMGPASYLLGTAGHHQAHHRYQSLWHYMPGKANALGDDPSRLWHLTDPQLLAHFDSQYPQKLPWKIAQLRPEMRSVLISNLRRKRSEPALYLNEPPTRTPTGPLGRPSVPRLEPQLRSKNSHRQTSYLYSRFSLPLYDTDSLVPAKTRSEVEQWVTTSRPLARRSPTWVKRTLG